MNSINTSLLDQGFDGIKLRALQSSRDMIANKLI
jgi:hypothetical protein